MKLGPPLDLVAGQPFWPLRSGLLAAYPSLQEDLECEVAIIGGGITGAMLGFYLAEAGLDAVVLDRRDIGFGSTGASTALLLYEIDTSLRQLGQLHGERAAVRTYQLGRDAIRQLAALTGRLDDSCDFCKRESLYLASRTRDAAGLQREARLRQRNGFEVEYWSRDRLAAEAAIARPAALCSQGAAEVDGYRLTHALLRAGTRRGLRVFDRTGVIRWQSRPRRIELRLDHGRRVSAGHLVLAPGYEAAALVGRQLTALHSTYVVVSEPVPDLSGWPERRLIWETARPYVFLRTTADHRVMIGGRDESFRDPATRDRLLPAKARALQRTFQRLFPAIPFEPAYAWTGTFAVTGDGLPYIDRTPGDPRVWLALGYAGNGMTYAVIAAEIIREHLLGGQHADARWFRIDRPGNPRPD